MLFSSVTVKTPTAVPAFDSDQALCELFCLDSLWVHHFIC
jgi:hypothetical protein